MISTTRINDELTKAINTRYALIQLYVDASIFGAASRMYRCIKDIMTLYALEKALYNAVYYDFDETEIETLIYKIREFIGIINYVSNVEYLLMKYPNLTCPIRIPDNYVTSGDGQGNVTNITNNYPTVYIKSATINTEEWLTQDLTPLVTIDGQLTITPLDFNIGNVDVDSVFLEVQGDNPDYRVDGDGYHIVGNTLHWHKFYSLKVGVQIKIRWRVE